jgi:O-acetyl-ADP-ribose deacetylase (regulator of RNase III)
MLEPDYDRGYTHRFRRGEQREPAMTPIRYIKGDATAPQTAGNKIIAHICNDRGGYAKGFVEAINKRWPGPKRAYRDWYRERANNDFALGAIQFVNVETGVWVANMVGQHGLRPSRSQGPPIRYDAVQSCLAKVAEKARELQASVHMPRIGCGLAGGKWERIEPIIAGQLCEQGIAVTVYDRAAIH